MFFAALIKPLIRHAVLQCDRILSLESILSWTSKAYKELHKLFTGIANSVVARIGAAVTDMLSFGKDFSWMRLVYITLITLGVTGLKFLSLHPDVWY